MSADKFEKEDLPKILATLKRAREGKAQAKLIVEFSADGGVISIHLESKIKVK